MNPVRFPRDTWNSKAERRTQRGTFFLRMCLIVMSASRAEGASVGTVPFIFDDNRIFAELQFVRPDGTLRKTFAYVDLGTPLPVISDALYRELRVDQKMPLALRLGEIELRAAPALVQTDSAFMTGPNGKRTVPVEAVLAGSQLKDYQVVLDYGQRSLTIARPGTLEPRGLAVPCRVNESTGLVSVSALIDGHLYAVALDPGSAYTWFKKETTQKWQRNHPQWERGTGAVGESNMQTRADGAEAGATILRLPEITLAGLHLTQIGALGITPHAPPFPPVPRAERVEGDFFDWYSKKAPEPVIGWLGGNVLQGFRVMIDYPRHMTYWERERELDPHDLDQVGVTLETRDNEKGYFVAAVANKNGKPTMKGVRAGDRLVGIDSAPLEGRTRGALFSSLHGKPGDIRVLTLERHGREFTMRVPVSAF